MYNGWLGLVFAGTEFLEIFLLLFRVWLDLWEEKK